MSEDLKRAQLLCGLANGVRSDLILVCIDLEKVDAGDFQGEVTEVGVSTLDLRNISLRPTPTLEYADHMTLYVRSYHFRVSERGEHRNRHPKGCPAQFDWVSVPSPFVFYTTNYLTGQIQMGPKG
jgi:hypothetical protein